MKSLSSTPKLVPDAEWLETDGLGGFASGTVSGIRTRRYHALLLTAQTPPTGRIVLVNGFDAWVETPAGRFALTSHRYSPDVVSPDGSTLLKEFSNDPWPRWLFELPDGTRIAMELFVPHGQPAVVVSWKLLRPVEGVVLRVRPFLSGRDYHSLHHENAEFRFEPEIRGDRLEWNPYEGVPRIAMRSNAAYRHDPLWYRQFQYDAERERGLDHLEDLASPGELSWDISAGEAVWFLTRDTPGEKQTGEDEPLMDGVKRLRLVEVDRRRSFATPLHRAADAYIVRRGGQKTLRAGYPWFTDWGRDTFIAMRGLCIATGRLGDALDILLTWAAAVSLGMVPNRFPDRGEVPEYNSVDASLWFVVAVHDFLSAAESQRFEVGCDERARLVGAVEAILEGYCIGTRHRIQATEEGLLASGEPGLQLTWMDAKVGDWVVTPRIGKPVEVQALWVNALWIGSQFNSVWKPLFTKARESFGVRFWNEERKCLFDGVDCDHVPGRTDAAIRPNQIFAIGGLPLSLLEGERARLVLETVGDQLLTPLGLRSMAPGEQGYCPRYVGGVAQRDGAYHQGTVWPWLLGAYVEAWLRVHGNTAANRRTARSQFVAPLMAHLQEAGLGHVSEIVDAEAPHEPRGCPWQAWSLGELIRLERLVLAETMSTRRSSMKSFARKHSYSFA